MHRRIVIAFAAAVLAVVPPALTRAHSTDHGSAHGDADDFGWAIVSGDDVSTSGWPDHPMLESLKERYGDEFLVVVDHERRFVIADEKLVERAQDAARDLKKYGREIGEIARAQARLSLGDARQDRGIARLERRCARLQQELRDQARDDESTGSLEEELLQVKAELQALESVQRSFALTSDDRKDLTKRQEEASERLRRAVGHINATMQDILKDARARHLAEPVE
jgi:hypothetical protein